MRGIDISCVILLSGHKLHPCIIIRQHILKAVSLRILWKLGNAALTAGPFLWCLLIFCKNQALLQLLLQ